MLHDWFTQCIQSPPVTVSVLVPVISVLSYCYIILYYIIIIIITIVIVVSLCNLQFLDISCKSPPRLTANEFYGL